LRSKEWVETWLVDGITIIGDLSVIKKEPKQRLCRQNTKYIYQKYTIE